MGEVKEGMKVEMTVSKRRVATFQVKDMTFVWAPKWKDPAQFTRLRKFQFSQRVGRVDGENEAGEATYWAVRSIKRS